MEEKVNHPKHYGGDIYFEAIKIIDDWGLGFSAGNALKYIIRAPYKGSEQEDIKKALWYIDHANMVKEKRFARDSIERKPEDVSRFWNLPEDLSRVISYLRDLDFEKIIPILQAKIK